jgi:hypothetical protein
MSLFEAFGTAMNVIIRLYSVRDQFGEEIDLLLSVGDLVLII